MRKLIILMAFLYYSIPLLGKTWDHVHDPEKHARIDLNNLASLQRGAKYFMNFCSGCHSLQFMRYNRLGMDLKIIDNANSIVSNQRLSHNLIFTQATQSDTIQSSLYKKDALLWFGKNPPDLSLTIRAKGADWVYNYLLSFYPDDRRPFGVNNSLIKNTIMPDPLSIIRKQLPLSYPKKNNKSFNFPHKNNNSNQLLINPNNYKTFVLEHVVTDLVNFLAYTAEPIKTERESLGIKVCGFLLVFAYVVYLLKKQIWNDKK